jgi:betaine-aldehyde dehydrogenase
MFSDTSGGNGDDVMNYLSPERCKSSLFINGKWQQGEGETIKVFEPATNELLATLKGASTTQVDDAVKAARAALSTWSTTTGAQRAIYLRGFAAHLTSRRDALIQTQIRNNGKPRHEAEVDVDDAIATFNYYAVLADQLDVRQGSEVALAVSGFKACVRYEAVGVVGLIVPWNFPLVTSAWKIAPALAAGCSVVLKTSEVTPLIEMAYGDIAYAQQLPAGVLNILAGAAETGRALSEHGGVDKLSFTGSTATGSRVMQTAARRCQPVTLELGGKSAILVFEDCDLDQAVEWIVAGICWNAGQMCSATSRLLVQHSIADALFEKLTSALDNVRVGDQAMGETGMGPISSSIQWLKVQEYFAIARAEGLSCRTGGKALERAGWFVAPTLYTEVPTSSRLWTEEIFGPVLCARRFADEFEAIAVANDSEYGLVATVITADQERAERVAAQLEVGHVWINSFQAVFVETSWGGVKGSGFGRELGPWGLSAYQTIKHITRRL